MKIIIENFRTYNTKKEFVFNDQEISLLSGVSGIGKSTIFEAISWCLYDSMQHIYSNCINSNKNTKVILEINGMTIKRTKPPSILEIIFENGDLLTDNAAKNYIEKFFGTKDLWYSSSYIVQSEKCPLLTLSNSKKFELLREITFGSEEENQKPNYYLNILNLEIEKISTIIIEENASFKGYFESYNTLLERYSDSLKNYNKFEHNLEDLNEKKISTIDKLKKTQKLNIKISDLENKCNNLETDVTNLNIKKESIKIDKDINILYQLLEYLKIKKNIEDLYIDKSHLILEKYQREQLMTKLLKYKEFPDKKIVLEEKIKKNNYNFWFEKYEKFKKYKDQLAKYNKYVKDLKKIKDIDVKIIKINKYIEYNSLKHKYDVYMKKKKIYDRLQKINLIIENLEIKNDYEEKLNKYNSQKRFLILTDEITKLKQHDIYENSIIKQKQYNEDLSKIENLEKIKENNNKKVLYDIELEKYNKHLDDKKLYCNLLDNLIFVKQEISKISFKIEDIDILEVKEKIYSLNLLKNEIYCPHCNNGLKIINPTKLEKGISTLEEKNKNIEELKILEIIVENYDKLLKLENEKVILEDKCSNFNLLNIEEPVIPVYDHVIKFNGDIKKEIIRLTNNLEKPDLLIEKPLYEKPKGDLKILIKELNSIINKYKDMQNLELLELPIKPDYIEFDKQFLENLYDEKKKLCDNKLLYEPEIVVKPESIDDYEEGDDVDIELLEEDKIQIIPKYCDKPEKIDEFNMDKPEEGLDLNYELYNELYCELGNLSKHEIISSINSLNNVDSYQQLINKIQNYNCDVNYLEELKTIDEVEKVILKIKSDENQLIFLNSELSNKKLETEKLFLEKEKYGFSSENLNAKIEKYDQKISKIDQMIINCENVNIVKTHRKTLKNKEKNILEQNTYLGNLNKLKNIITEVATHPMEEILENLNDNINSLLEELFEDDIYVRLNTHKNLKSGNSKLQVNLEIEYKGIIYDNINFLSGGEQSRISFAITLALNKLNNSPFILLDEFASGLDSSLREKCIKIIKRNFSHVTIVHICHEIINGLHDSTIEL